MYIRGLFPLSFLPKYSIVQFLIHAFIYLVIGGVVGAVISALLPSIITLIFTLPVSLYCLAGIVLSFLDFTGRV